MRRAKAAVLGVAIAIVLGGLGLAGTGSGQGAPVDGGSRIFGYLIVGRLEGAGTVLSHLFPVFAYEGGNYHHARIADPPDSIVGSRSRSVLNQTRNFELYDRGTRVGQYRIARLGIFSRSGCQKELVGVGVAS